VDAYSGIDPHFLIALSQTTAYAARVYRAISSHGEPVYCFYSLYLPTEGWPG